MFRSSSANSPQDPRLHQLLTTLSQELFGTEGPSAELDFATIEQLAHDAGRQVARQLCEEAAARQARTADNPQPCPDCGRSCSGSIATRELLTRDGPIPLDEASYHCPHCRRVFFPQPTEPTLEPSSL